MKLNFYHGLCLGLGTLWILAPTNHPDGLIGRMDHLEKEFSEKGLVAFRHIGGEGDGSQSFTHGETDHVIPFIIEDFSKAEGQFNYSDGIFTLNPGVYEIAASLLVLAKNDTEGDWNGGVFTLNIMHGSRHVSQVIWKKPTNARMLPSTSWIHGVIHISEEDNTKGNNKIFLSLCNSTGSPKYIQKDGYVMVKRI